MASVTVAIGSTNRVKLDSTRDAFNACFPSHAVAFDAVSAASGVPDQPMGDAETRRGAHNRAMNAARAYRSKHGSWPTYAIGLEGGCQEDVFEEPVFSLSSEERHVLAGTAPEAASVSSRPELACGAWIAVLHVATGRWGAGKTGTFALPEAVAALVRSGVELGHADDRVFGRSGSKEKDGAVGLLTKGVMDRAAYYQHACILALIPFISAEHYTTGIGDCGKAADAAAAAGAPAASL
jgi:non-canonical (house-cleaning) NTP pyrophosphatase